MFFILIKRVRAYYCAVRRRTTLKGRLKDCIYEFPQRYIVKPETITPKEAVSPNFFPKKLEVALYFSLTIRFQREHDEQLEQSLHLAA